ncbi:kelch-like protein 25 [Arctopsyche grandis]|uniref:kelch-like protein 25 n=1 Tax=Arctopsyche grandis TaxID=121162 RepID=UPI00406D6CEE
MCDSTIYTQWMKTLMNDENNWEDKRKESLSKIRSNYMQVFRESEYMHLSFETFKELLDSEEINVECEEIIFDSVRKWIKCNEPDEDEICLLLKIVKYQNLSLKYIMNEVEIFTSPFERIRKLVMDALRWHLFPEERSKLDFTKQTSSEYKLLSLGSYSLSTKQVVEVYDSFNNKWTRLKDLKINRRAFGVAFIDGKVMLIGGTSSGEEKDPVNTVESLDLTTGSIQTMEPLKVKRHYCATAVIGNGKFAVLYVIGGWGHGVKELNSVERWDPISKTWSVVTPMNVSRCGCCCAVLNGNIYVGGGRIQNVYTNSFEMFNVNENKWETKASFFEMNAYVGMTATREYIYLIGGYVNYKKTVNQVSRYDPKSNAWTKIANIMSSGGVAAITIGNKPICVGGISPDMQEYDEKKNEWKKLAPLNVAREGFVVKVPYNKNFNW